MNRGQAILSRGQFDKGIDMGKKIAVLLDSEPEWGGEHQYASILMECLKDVDDIELVAVCSSRYWRKWCKEHAIRILDVSWPSFTEDERKFHIRCPLFSWTYTMYMTQFGAMLRKEKINAVLCTTQGVFLPNLNVKVIAPVHDLMHRYEGRFPEVRQEYEGRELYFSSLAKYAWCIQTDSKVGRQQFLESYSKYIRKGHTHVVSLPFTAPKHIVDCKEEFIETPSKYVFYPAQFWQHKNHINLIRAVHLLVKDIPDIHLVLVGSEKNNIRAIKKYISEHELESNVTIKGFISNENMTYLYRHAVGMIMPSYFGPTNIPPLEAMALGCPVAVSNKYAMPEQVGNAGLLFNPDSPEEIAECIKKLWLDEELRQSMIKKGFKRVERWTTKEFGKKLQRIIEAI